MFDSASATSVRNFFVLLSSGDELVSIRSCLMLGLTSSPSSKLELVNGDDEARRLGVEEAAPSTQRSAGAGNLGEAGGGVCTLVVLPDAFFVLMGAEILGLRVFTTESGSVPSSESRSRSLAGKQ